MHRIHLLPLAAVVVSSGTTISGNIIPGLDLATRSPTPDSTAKTSIIGGDIATPGSTPWLVSIRDAQYHPPPHFCGGTILNHYWILTTASCITTSSSNLLVVLGEYNQEEDEGFEKTRTPVLSLIHPKYTYFNMHAYNVALLLVTYFSYGERIQPAPLLPKSDDLIYRRTWQFSDGVAEEETRKSTHSLQDENWDLEGVDGLIAGWGRMNSEDYSSVVLEANLTILPNDVCQSAYPDEDMESLMCASDIEHGGVGACMGDSGGGLISKEGYILGIYSYAEPCASDEFPGIYVNISVIEHWMCPIIRNPQPQKLLRENTDFRIYSSTASLN